MWKVGTLGQGLSTTPMNSQKMFTIMPSKLLLGTAVHGETSDENKFDPSNVSYEFWCFPMGLVCKTCLYSRLV